MRNKNKILSLIYIVIITSVICAGCNSRSISTKEDIALSSIANTAANASKAVTAKLADNYATYFTADEYKMLYDDYVGSFGGVGIYMVENDENEIVIYEAMEGYPAAKAGIVGGDAILAVDGQKVSGDQFDKLPMMVRGEIGTTVDLKMQRAADNSIYNVSLKRVTVESKSLKGEFLEDMPGVLYVSIFDFTTNTPKEFVELYNKLSAEQPVNAIIFDLRNNGGGSFQAAISLAEYFVPDGNVIVSEKSSDGETVTRSKGGDLSDTPVVILQNQYSASASEVLIGALKDNDIAETIGCKSYGKGITQILEELPSGSAIRYTHSRYLTPDGFDLHGVGLEPEIKIAEKDDTAVADYYKLDVKVNPYLAAAENYLKDKLNIAK